jgi:hypothetical protein
MFNADVVTFQEFAMQEPLPLAVIQTAVLEFISGRPNLPLRHFPDFRLPFSLDPAEFGINCNRLL